MQTAIGKLQTRNAPLTTSSIVVDEVIRLLRPLTAEVLGVGVDDDEDIELVVLALVRVDLERHCRQSPLSSSKRVSRTTIAMLLTMIVTKEKKSQSTTQQRIEDGFLNKSIKR